MNLHTFPKIDAHFHATQLDEAYVAIAKRYHLRYININTDADVFPTMEVQEQIARLYQDRHPEHFNYVCSFSMEGWQEKGFIDQVIAQVKKAIAQGAVGVKVWKNIGMELRDKKGKFLMIDDPLFTPLFHYLALKQIPVVAHLGEPLNCWLPLEEMSSARNRAYYIQHPQYHAYLHPEIPSYAEQIEARDRLLFRHPTLKFIGAHLGSMEWSYQEIAQRLAIYPHFSVDLSSRLGHLQLQSITDYEGVREFFIRYADRLIYGTDAYNNLEKLENSLQHEWQYLTTFSRCWSSEVNQWCKGLALPEEVIYPIYYGNAEKIYLQHRPEE